MWLELLQIPIYGCAVIAGVVLGWQAPSTSAQLSIAVDPAVIILICATLCAVPFSQLPAALKNGKFLSSLVVVNFLIVPAVVAALCLFFVALLFDDPTLLLPILLVLLAPCVDYVIVFSRMAGGNWQSLLAATPILMLMQLVLLPVYLSVAPGAAQVVLHWQPFIRAFGLFILLPLVVALVLQRWGVKVMPIIELLMVPLLAITLFIVVGAHSGTIFQHLQQLWTVVPIFICFGLVMPIIGNLWGKWRGLDEKARCALSFSATTRNSLVVLPFALALIPVMPLAPVIVVTQTVVELMVMVVLVASWRWILGRGSKVC